MHSLNNNKNNDKNIKPVIYPDQLNIIIRSSVPGYQQIDYMPSMTMKDIPDRRVYFNPFIKLNKSKIETIPEEYRIKEFFNKGLFQSLLNYNGGTPSRSLIESTRNGYVDNNIRVTIETIFPIKSVIYIGKSPYVITDVQWSTGDWKIEIKQKQVQIPLHRISDPLLFTQMVRNEIVSGEEQLEQIPTIIRTGANYVEQPNIYTNAVNNTGTGAQGTDAQGTDAQGTNVNTKNVNTTGTGTDAQETNVNTNNGQLVKQPVKPLQKPLEQQQLKPLQKPLEQQQLKPLPPPKQTPLPITNQPTNTKLLPPIPQVEEISIEEERLFENFKETLQVNTNSTSFFKNYFKNNKYKYIVKTIYNFFSPELQKIIRIFYINTTRYNPPRATISLSDKSYDTLCDQVSIIKSNGNGDCFFQAVSQGINIYNYANQDSKIVYSNYGITQLFTIAVLREIVVRYLQKLGSVVINDMLSIAKEQLEPLNNLFKETIDNLKIELGVQKLSPEQYLSELNNIYYRNSNFLVYKPKVVPIDMSEYDNPFRILTVTEIPNYIKSQDYWANAVAIEAICSILNICIIPIENYEYTTNNSKNNNSKNNNLTTRLRSLLTNDKSTQNTCSKKIMFLFYKNNHYELIRFTYKTIKHVKITAEGLEKEDIYLPKWYTIFKIGDLMPPIHILLLIYSSNYRTLEGTSQDQFSIYLNVMQQIQLSIYKILNLPKIVQNFVKIFDNVFPNYKSILSLKPIKTNPNTLQINDIDDTTNETDVQAGGQYMYNNYYNPSNRVSSPYIKPQEVEPSKIAYTITVYMELHPGTQISQEELKKSKCNSKYNSMRKSFADFTGTPYVIPPVYKSTQNTKKNVNQNNNHKTRKNI